MGKRPTVIQVLTQLMGKYLSEQPWHTFGTFTTEYSLTSNQARRLAERLYTDMSRKAPDSVYMFWVAEQFLEAKDYHLHALIYAKGADHNRIQTMVTDSWKRVSRFRGQKAQNIIHLDEYDLSKGASYYISKHIKKPMTDYDFMIPEIKTN